MKFRKIVQLDACGLVSPYKEKIFDLSVQSPVLYDTIPGSDEEIIARIGDADCVLVSWNTMVNAHVIYQLPNVKYIGMCCSLYDEASANVDIAASRKQGIVVKGVRDYGDNGTLEFIFAELICLMKGMGSHQWRKEPTELTGKMIGVIGMGVLGTMVARTARHFGMNVIYYSRSRKEDIEQEGICYVELKKLLSDSDIITTHLPRNTVVLDKENIGLLKHNAIYINTSLGQPYETEPFLSWIGQGSGNYAIFDAAGSSTLAATFKSYPNIILFDRSSGFTSEAKGRLTEKILNNMLDYLSMHS